MQKHQVLTREEVPLANERVAALYVGLTAREAKDLLYRRTQLAGYTTAETALLDDEIEWDRHLLHARWR